MNRCGIITAGVFAVIAGGLSTAKGILVLISGTTVACSDLVTDDYYYYDEDACATAVIVASTLALSGGLFWIATAICTFVFSCGNRIRKFDDDEDDHDTKQGPSTVAVQVQAASQSYQTKITGDDV